jgi:hypothetical protein
MCDVHARFGEGVRVEQLFDALAGGQLPFGMLFLDLRFSAALERGGSPFFQVVNDFFAHKITCAMFLILMNLAEIQASRAAATAPM